MSLSIECEATRRSVSVALCRSSEFIKNPPNSPDLHGKIRENPCKSVVKDAMGSDPINAQKDAMGSDPIDAR